MRRTGLGVLVGLLLATALSWAAANFSGEPLGSFYADGTWRCADGTLNCIAHSNTAQPTSEATPTAELTPLPTMTPFPTAVPKACVLQARITVNIRISPAGVWSGTWTALQTETFTEFYYIPEGFLWGHHTRGWSVIFNEADLSDSAWWVAGTESSDVCKDIDTWPDHLMPPEPFVQVYPAWLIHVIPGANAQEILTSYPILDNKNIPFGVKSYVDVGMCTQALDAGGFCIYRFPVHGDCPDVRAPDPKTSAATWMEDYERAVSGALFSYKSTGRLYIELVNECNYGSPAELDLYYWWATWLETAVDYAVAHHWPKIVAPSFGPGYGDTVQQYSIWKPALLKLAQAEGLIGFHAYTPYHNEGLCSCDEWLACRHRRNYDALQSLGIDLEYAITEAARGWGNDPVDEQDFDCWYDKIYQDAGLHSVSAWLGGPHVIWPRANLDGHYVSLANGLLH